MLSNYIIWVSFKQHILPCFFLIPLPPHRHGTRRQTSGGCACVPGPQSEKCHLEQSEPLGSPWPYWSSGWRTPNVFNVQKCLGKKNSKTFHSETSWHKEHLLWAKILRWNEPMCAEKIHLWDVVHVEEHVQASSLVYGHDKFLSLAKENGKLRSK